MNRRGFLAGLLCAVATLNLGAGGSTSLANTRAPEEVTTIVVAMIMAAVPMMTAVPTVTAVPTTTPAAPVPSASRVTQLDPCWPDYPLDGSAVTQPVSEPGSAPTLSR
jgi:hypothetical protein